MKFIACAVLTMVFLCSLSALASEPVFTIMFGDLKKEYSRTELLKRSDVQQVTTKVPDYDNQEATFTAVPASALFHEIKSPTDATVVFKALDGFSAPLPLPLLLNTDASKARAYVAIEKPTETWALVKQGAKKTTAGPFFLIWVNPQLSGVNAEYWPYQLASFEIKGAVEQEFKNIFPASSLAKSSPILAGFKTFRERCFSCHTLNKEGTSQVGPDLNVHLNVMERFSDAVLKKIIRNPQSVRYWPNSRMVGFPKEVMSDRELENTLAYLKHMKSRKVTHQ